MKPALQLRLGQSLALTPQLQQAIRLLQLSRLELELELNSALETNPLLEQDEGSDEEGGDELDAQSQEDVGSALDEGAASGEDTFDDLPDTPLDLEHSDYRKSTASSEEFEAQDAVAEDLRDHLLWQLNLTSMSARDRAIGVALIEAIDDDGYLVEGDEALIAALAPLHGVSAAEVEMVRRRVQQFDPIGVGSRSLAECLDVQLGAFAADTPGLALARSIVREHLEALARKDRVQLSAALQVTPEEFDVALALVRSLSPKPGAAYSSVGAEYVAPDAYARKVGGRWQVFLAGDCQPRLSINEYYSGLIAKARRDDANYLKGQLQEARWLIKSLKTRADTILKVARSIVSAQEAFLEFGPEGMRPLVLKDVAEELGMHESTISRVTTRKFLHTPRGTFEFKYFFSSGVTTSDGGAASATAVQAMIRKLIDEESPSRPLSDQGLTLELNRRGINVARRTVAKYREALNIPSSNDRSRLGSP
ncbi:MAG: RNA polymerase factor sigma-54 [Dokdonella sp.]|uniref:RNA polymerase factor sigma-54 n=1 Tax=Dokdonella sp. TaxID=2291710 RepID=UPI0025C3176E|nr:RNA polymerase factor sigma-54 [Dokdonella sp.]MBZ0222782.1 RNA polymerase factor sigma-54 [Dokdonella sp.]